MGFDNDCILNIQSLAGEYFCPVCRLLVYPNEALQSQCTHLYCKPCLTYVTSTTRACPYDGYLVTEADSKPLSESNKALAETIGKITVHCLYHRSGCTWQGPLSDCTSHCSGCSFGNSPVVCNRCGIQIVHRQVQEHAQNCLVVQPQAQGEGVQNATATETPAAGDQTQVAAKFGGAVTQAYPSQTTTSSDTNKQANPSSQPQAAVPTAEQWYHQQQQYHQYYQQYPGYDPYQQYHPYQQQAVQQYPQPQVYMQPQSSQSQSQLQSQPQSQPYIQPTATQPQVQPQVNSQQQTQPQPQIQSQAHPPPQGQPHPQAQLHPQILPVQLHPQHVHMPQYQQPHSQIQHLQTQVHAQNPVAQPPSQGLPQTQAQNPLQPPPQPYASQMNQPVNPHLQPQPQHSSAHAVTGHHSYPQPQAQQQMQMGGQQHPVPFYPQGPQSQYPSQMQNQYLQQPPPLRPPQSHVPFQNPQQSGLVPSSGQASVPPSQQHPVYSHAPQPGLPFHHRPVVQSVQQPINQPYVQQQQQQQQQPFSGQVLGSVQNQVHPQGVYAHQQLHVQSQLRPQGLSPSFQQPYQTQNLGGRPMVPPHGVPLQPHPLSSAGMQVKAVQVGTGQQFGNPPMTTNAALFSSEQRLGAASRPMSDRQDDHISEKGTDDESASQKNDKRNPNGVDVAPGLGSDASEVKAIKSETYLKPLNDDNKSINEAKDTSKSPRVENGEPLLKKEETADGTNEQRAFSNAEYKQVEPSALEDKEMKDNLPLKTHSLREGDHFEDQRMKIKDVNQVQGDQGKQQPPLIPHGPSALQQRPVGSLLLQAPPLGPPHHMQLPAPVRPLGLGNMPHSGQPLHPPAENLQQPQYKQPYGPEVSPAGPGSTSVSGGGQSHYIAQGPYPLGERTQSYGHESDMFPNQRPNYADGRRLDLLGQQSGRHSNAMRMNGAPGTDLSPAFGLRDDRFRPLPEEHMNPFPKDAAWRNSERRDFEDDLKLFPRPSHLDNESGRFLSSRPLDRRPLGFGTDKPLEKEQHGLNYDSGMKLETLGGPPPSRFFPPYHDGVMRSGELGERPLGFHDKTVGRQPEGRTHHEFFGPVPRYDMGPRSPFRDYPGVSSHGFGALPGVDDIDGREPRRFGELFRGGRFPVLPSHFHRGELEGPGQDGYPGHMRRGELGSHNLHGHLGEPVGFDAFPGPGNFFQPQLGEPGFRSNFSLKAFPGDGGKYAGDLEAFDNSRRRKPTMGWCRICKVDCETIEGLDLHSQTREHQKKTMDMVLTIKQNAKKQKITSSDRPSFDDASKSRNASFEGRGNKK